jgi:hypothetical protein
MKMICVFVALDGENKLPTQPNGTKTFYLQGGREREKKGRKESRKNTGRGR